MYDIIDVHVHDPEIFNIYKNNPRIIADILIKSMDENNIKKIFLYALEADPSKILNKISNKELFKGVENILSKGIYVLPKDIMDSIEDPDKARIIHVSNVKTAYSSTERIVKISRYSNGRILPVGSIPIYKSKEEFTLRIESMLRLRVKGVKIYPTIQFIKPSEKRLYPLYKALEDNGIPLFIHTGCDPGLWELPYFCTYADPTNIEAIAKEFKDLTIILCHTGAYSALKPGIFVDKAIKLINKYENIYGDTSAVDPYLLTYILKKINPGKILFGSDYPVVGRVWGKLINNVKLLDIPENIKRKIFFENASRIFNI